MEVDVVTGLKQTSVKADGTRNAQQYSASENAYTGNPLPSPSSTFAISAMLVGLLVFLVAGTPPVWGAGVKWTSRALALVLLVLLLVWHFRRRYYRPQWQSHRRTRVWQLPGNQAYVLQRSAGQSRASAKLSEADAVRLRVFTRAIIYPAAYRQRITERYEPGQRTLVQRVTIDAQIPGRELRQILNPRDLLNGHVRTTSAPQQRTATASQEISAVSAESTRASEQVILFPILVPRKGEMVDNLRILASDGSALPTLSYRQYLQLVAEALRTLLDISYGRDISEGAQSEAIEAEIMALADAMQRAAPDGRYESNSGADAIRLLGAGDTNGEVANKGALTLAAQLITKLTSHYAVVAAVPCPPDGRFVISYERLMTPTLELAPLKEGVLAWFKARARLFFGSRPVDFSVSLDNAWTTQSYHLVVDAEDKVFVGVQEAPALIPYFTAHWNRLAKSAAEGDSQPIARAARLTTPPPYYRFQRRAGQRYAHFYTRFFPEPREDLKEGTQVPEVRFRFYEVPPGSVFRAVITASAAALLIWLIGFVASRKTDPGTDVPAFLLVFPAIAAAWLGFDGQPRRLLEGTLAARLSLVTTVLSSIAASGLYMINKAQLPHLAWDNFFGIQVLGIDSLAWSALTMVAIVNASCISYIYLARTWEFMHLSSRPSQFDSPKEFLVD
ncbi:hypothetical protein [Micromonospora thermarum]|uniref:Uncharacterized protein n=1 Tax=Micromonospora thermarum TaxID=2720024 RepID=A0ABX0Z8Q8_9ACTN|nr:hypothetical protein [Micromonospora thermarum]NJP33359.1 hypothetical protein [Micromonospora thermarum]